MSSVTTPHRSDNDGPQPHLVISAHDGLIWKLVYLPDGRHVVTGSKGGTMKVWNLESGEQKGTSMKHESEICSLAVTRDGKTIISSYHGGVIKVWGVDSESHEIVKEWTHPESCPMVAISPNGRLIAVGAWTVAIHTMEGNQVNLNVGKAVWSMSFSPDGERLACGTLDDIRVYNVESGTLILAPLHPLLHPLPTAQIGQYWVFDVLWSRDGSRLFSADDKTIRCWNSDTGEQIGRPWRGHTSMILSLSLPTHGLILASASPDHTVRFWDATTGNPIGQHLQHDQPVYTVRFSPDGQFVASAGWNGKLYLWRAPGQYSVEHRVNTPSMWYVLTPELILCHFSHLPVKPTPSRPRRHG
jgi:WD40 repeat protein